MDQGYYRTLDDPVWCGKPKNFGTGVPVQAIRDFKKTVKPGDKFLLKIDRHTETEESYARSYTVECTVARCYPHIVVATNGKSAPYFDVMMSNGWWKENRYRYLL